MIYLFLKKLYKFKFLKRIIPSFLRLMQGDVTIKVYNFYINCSLKNSIDREIYLTNSYDEDRFNYLDQFTKKYKFEFFFDIGAYIGFYSLYYSSYIQVPNVICFEANKYNYEKLINNFELNNALIKSHNLGCSNMRGNGEIWYSDINKMGGSSIFNEHDNEIHKYKQQKISFEKISLDTIDNLYEHIVDKLILIKIDVERHELKVLEGSVNFFKNNKILMQIEIQNEKKNEVFLNLKSNGYNYLHSIDDDHYFSNFIKT